MMVKRAHDFAIGSEKALVSLCSDDLVSAKGALNLSSQQLPENASRESIGRAYHATETFAQGLGFAKSQLRLTTKGSDLLSNSERGRGADDSSPAAGSFSMGSHSTYGLSVVLQQVDIWLGCAELLQSLLGSGIATSLDDIADQESSGCLCDRLIIDDHTTGRIHLSEQRGSMLEYLNHVIPPGILDLVADKERFRMRAMMEEIRLLRMTMFRRQPCSRF
ncbi:uncharacterized protein LOC130774604 isoform X2 [Actinidia eriantha]|uniref:uncharacterized protein LOC130774604 isoform X2 n=1 Tax=Actinidia eriantha TaxID=165200 RepID=UPI002590C73E|nr:uncharacterized protein LOC130774604 isoform X2 [Actinidia eriantha]